MNNGNALDRICEGHLTSYTIVALHLYTFLVGVLLFSASYFIIQFRVSEEEEYRVGSRCAQSFQRNGLEQDGPRTRGHIDPFIPDPCPIEVLD